MNKSLNQSYNQIFLKPLSRKEETLFPEVLNSDTLDVFGGVLHIDHAYQNFYCNCVSGLQFLP